ncbi:glutathione-disulfide reductase [Synechococcus elongatus]|uniref:glutathione-disulfide reductase n=1 Tax=Synechococcus elongatus TaxID=32046 RepID=UPI0030D49EF4
MSFDYDLLVIGAGSGGLAASKRAASYGAKVAIAETDLVGGTCVIRGCVPKKLMVYASSFASQYHYAEAYGWSAVQPQFSWPKLIAAVDAEVNRLSRLHISLLEKAGVELLLGHAQFLDEHRVQVGDRQVTAAKILIAVGGRPIKLAIPGGELAITSREMFHLPEQPQRFAVIGGGYIGCEFAGILRGLGSEVTQIIRRDRILHGFDQELQEAVQTGMSQHGIQFRTGVTVERIDKTETGLQLSYSDGSQQTVDQVLMATGREPWLEGLNLDAAGVAIEGRRIAVDGWSRTNQPHIFAVGDCTDRVNLTPVAIAEGRAFADTEFGQKPRQISYENIASAVFSQPEACSVGLSEEAAKAEYGEDRIRIYRSRFRPMFYTLPQAEERVLMKLVVETESDRVLGAHMVGKDAAEIMQSVAIAVTMGATKADFDATMALHPTSAEEFVTMP